MKTRAEAEQLAATKKSVGEAMGVKSSHLLSPMDEPLGRNVGNALEVAECVEILQGRGPKDLVKLIVDLALAVVGDGDRRDQRSRLQQRLKDGSAWKKFVALVYAQDGDATTLEKLLEIRRARIIALVLGKKGGPVKKMDAEAVGRASVLLGGGRQRADDKIDFAVGLSGIKKIGEEVEAGEPLLTVHARNEQSLVPVIALLEKAVAIG
jgi:pyrimidine-nucleoside phosphorylase